MVITQSAVYPFLILCGTFRAFGYGLGLVTAPGKAPQRLYVVGTVLALSAAAFLILEFYVFILGPAFADKSG
jgi:hypothetical protein